MILVIAEREKVLSDTQKKINNALREFYSMKLENKGTDMFGEQPINVNSLK